MGIDFPSAVVLHGPPGCGKTFAVERLIEFLDLPKADGLDTDKIVDALVGKPLSDLAFVIREAARLAAKNNKTSVDQESMDAAMKALPKNQDRKNKVIGFVDADKK